MKEKMQKVKEMFGQVLVIVSLFVGIYYVTKAIFIGLFLTADWTYNKISGLVKKSHKEISEDASEVEFEE